MLTLMTLRPNVPNKGVIGSGINSTMLTRMYLALRLGTFHSVGGGTSGSAISPSVVIGRDCTMKNCPSAQHHSMSCGVSRSDSIQRPRRTNSATWASFSTRALCRDIVTGCSAVPSAVGTVITALSATSICLTFPVALSAMIVSGDTNPPTIASPKPQAALITTSSRLPFIGLAVNMTPAASARTMTCTTTARLTASWSMPCCTR